MNENSKIFVVGHTGLLGSAILKKLKYQGYTNLITKTHKELDLTNFSEVEKFFKKIRPEYVFLSAGLTGGILANKTYPTMFLQTNLGIQNAVFSSAHKYKVKNLMFYASSCVYPKYSPQPIKEDYLLTGKLEEISEYYAIAKIAGIKACKAYNTQYKKNTFIVLIPNSTFGPNDNFDPDNSHVISALIRKFYEAKIKKQKEITIWGSGKARREFIFSEDVADASIFIMNNTTRLENIHYNVGMGIDYSIHELADITSKIIGYKGKILWDKTKPDGVPRKLLDSTKIRELGWKPSTSLENGIKIAYEWYIKNSASAIRQSVG